MIDITKEKLLTHILYEMQMCLWSFYKKDHCVNIFEFNSIWITHKVCLRNLLCFFSMCNSAGKDEIIYNNFSFAEKTADERYVRRKSCAKYEQKLSVSIMHITKDRMDKSKNIDENIRKFESEVFPTMKSYISNFIYKLENENNIIYQDRNDNNFKVNISNELKNNSIIGMINVVKLLLENKV